MGFNLIHSVNMENKQILSEIVAENLRQLMAGSSTLNTDERVAKRSGIGKGTVERIRKNQVSTSILNLGLLAEAFNIPVVNLITKGAIKEISSGNMQNEDIRAVIKLMESTDDKGRRKIRDAAEETLAEYDAHLRRIGVKITKFVETNAFAEPLPIKIEHDSN